MNKELINQMSELFVNMILEAERDVGSSCEFNFEAELNDGRTFKMSMTALGETNE